MESPTLQIKGITKRFPGVLALDDINIDAYGGEILGLIGVNGAGKSTLMNVLAGVIQADSGEIIINGKPANVSSPKAAENSGIAFIHQEAVLFSSMTVAENMFISNLIKGKSVPFVDHKKMEEEAEKYLKLLGSELNPKTVVSELSIGDRQIVEIARALSKGASLMLFDEPTSSLSFKEKARLFDIMRSLRSKGTTLIFISHFLDEVSQICDRVAVLRDGAVSGKGMMSEFKNDDIVKLILGRSIVQYVPDKEKEIGETLLKVEGLSREKAPRNASFELKKGEILGLWGLLGSGRTELIRALLGFDQIESGEISIWEDGKMRRVTSDKLLKSCGYVTENRHDDGCFLPLSLWENTTSASLGNFASRFLKILDRKKEHEAGSEMISKLNIKASDIHIKVKQLSGGNQQKVIMGKWVQRQPRFYFLDEPTRGVDVGAKAEIHKIISKLTENGSSVILISSEIDEIMNLSDRVLIMRRGSIVREVLKEEINKDKLMSLCVGEG